MKKKSILIITFPQGGPFVWAQNLARELRKAGFDVTVASGRKEYVRQQFKFYDIVHSCVPVPNLLCGKYVLTVHGNFREEKMIARPFFWLMMKRVKHITVPSDFLKKVLGMKKALVIPNGIDLPDNTKKSYAMIGNNPVVGILTNFNFRPKADGVIRLARIMQNISPEMKLVIGGSGKLFEGYKKAILEIHPNTVFLGHCRREDLFNQIDVFTYYSMLDNQPIAVLEAMAYGLPVLSNVVGSVEEVLTGEMEKNIARSDSDYENLLRKLLDSQEERESNGMAAKKIAQDYSWEKIAEKFITLYR